MEVLPLPAPIAAPVLPDAATETAVATAPSKKHERELAEMLCAFCHEGEDSDDPDEDPLMPVETGRAKQHYAHENCIWWCPDVWQDKDLKWQNVGKSLSRCHRLKCAVCGEVRDQQIERRGPVPTLRISSPRFAAIPLSGPPPPSCNSRETKPPPPPCVPRQGDAPLGCKRAACRKNWHYPCAMEPTTGLVVLEDEFCVACAICKELTLTPSLSLSPTLTLTTDSVPKPSPDPSPVPWPGASSATNCSSGARARSCWRPRRTVKRRPWQFPDATLGSSRARPLHPRRARLAGSGRLDAPWGETGPLGAQPLPRGLELAFSKVANSTASDPPGRGQESQPDAEEGRQGGRRAQGGGCAQGESGQVARRPRLERHGVTRDARRG